MTIKPALLGAAWAYEVLLLWLLSRALTGEGQDALRPDACSHGACDGVEPARQRAPTATHREDCTPWAPCAGGRAAFVRKR